MPHTIAPDELHKHQIVNIVRNGIRLRCRVDHSDGSKVVFTHVRRSWPSILPKATIADIVANAQIADSKTSEVISLLLPRQTRNDSGAEWRSCSSVEINALTLVCPIESGKVMLCGWPAEVELVADPRWN